MSLSIGIVGLPNVGKSTLFNALSSKQAEAANYAFCTIDPNVGVVPVPDPRMDALVKLYSPEKVVPATVDFVDIAGLVRGASKGEGKGNAFLSHIREVDAIAHVVRCFEDENIVHVDNKVDPKADIETIETELILRDLSSVEKRLEKARKGAKGQNPFETKAVEICEKLLEALNEGKKASSIQTENEDQKRVLKELCLLTQKPMFYVANVHEDQMTETENNPLVDAVRKVASETNSPVVCISAKIESEIMQLETQEEKKDFLESVGLEEPGLHQVIQTGYAMLDLITFFTAGPKEVHAWTLQKNLLAPQAAGKIHTDFERGFIRAEVIRYEDLVELGGETEAKAKGKMSVEGKEYVVRDGDVVHFRFNV